MALIQVCKQIKDLLQGAPKSAPHSSDALPTGLVLPSACVPSFAVYRPKSRTPQPAYFKPKAVEPRAGDWFDRALERGVLGQQSEGFSFQGKVIGLTKQSAVRELNRCPDLIRRVLLQSVKASLR